jgi:hypothetical protein
MSRSAACAAVALGAEGRCSIRSEVSAGGPGAAYCRESAFGGRLRAAELIIQHCG